VSYVKPSEYLKFLAAKGYPLSAVEETITRGKTSEEVYSEYCS
jgi:hypothetical protein